MECSFRGSTSLCIHCLCPLLQMPLEEKYSGVRGQALVLLRYMLLDTPPGSRLRLCSSSVKEP